MTATHKIFTLMVPDRAFNVMKSSVGASASLDVSVPTVTPGPLNVAAVVAAIKQMVAQDPGNAPDPSLRVGGSYDAVAKQTVVVIDVNTSATYFELRPADQVQPWFLSAVILEDAIVPSPLAVREALSSALALAMASRA